MTYFLDFDRTLFDTEAYYTHLVDRSECKEFRDDMLLLRQPPADGLGSGDAFRQNVWSKISALLESGALAFGPGELSIFLYADVVEFLRQMGNEAIIITFGDKLRQRAKVESALSGVVRLTVLYTELVHKADFLLQYPHLVPAQAIFVDDYVYELEKMSQAFPAAKLFQMRRDGTGGDGRWPVIRSLHELP